MAVVLDTHAAVWFLLDSRKLSPNALRAIEASEKAGDPVFVPSVSIVEVVYLVERGRLPATALSTLSDALKSDDSALTIVPLDSEVGDAVRRVPRDVVPDMPDRIIAATALHLGLPLVTRDQRIRSAGLETIW